jgi:hypothetical protein
MIRRQGEDHLLFAAGLGRSLGKGAGTYQLFEPPQAPAGLGLSVEPFLYSVEHAPINRRNPAQILIKGFHEGFLRSKRTLNSLFAAFQGPGGSRTRRLKDPVRKSG